MGTLREALKERLDLDYREVDNQTYDWEATILRNGVELAAALIAAPAADGIALVGHSMGGLVCRVANCALTDPRFKTVVTTHAKGFQKDDLDAINRTALGEGLRVGAVVTLATPNSGAMTHGQMSVLAHALHLVRPLWARSEGVADLNTDRLFRILQHCRTPTPCLTISGSWGNRLIRGSGSITAHHLLQWTMSMREPHDMIVEDISVDLTQSILPHEFTVPPVHQRLYVDCIDVKHTNIHETAAVHTLVADFIGSNS